MQTITGDQAVVGRLLTYNPIAIPEGWRRLRLELGRDADDVRQEIARQLGRVMGNVRRAHLEGDPDHPESPAVGEAVGEAIANSLPLVVGPPAPPRAVYEFCPDCSAQLVVTMKGASLAWRPGPDPR